MRLPAISVRWKLIAAVSSLIAAVVVFQVLYFPARQGEQAIAALGAKARSVSALLAHDIKAAVLFGDKKGVEEVFQGVREDQDLDFLVVLDPDGTPLATLNPERAPSYKSMPRIDDVTEELTDERLTVLSPITSEAKVAGVLVASFSTARIREEQSGNQQAALLTGLTVLALGVLTAIAMGEHIGGRLSRLGRLARRVAEGDLDVMVEARETRFRDEIGELGQDVSSMLSSLRALNESAGEVSRGDLRADITARGDLADAFRAMLESLRQLVSRIKASSAEINASAAEVFATARQQEEAATHQATGIEETRRTMGSLLDSSRAIAESAETVLQNAELTLKNNRLIAERTGELLRHIQRITEILEAIKDIANKSDLLALNASLEGTKAGEAGRGFSLVAAQMQRLAENVMGSVGDIKRLVSDIREAGHGAALATEEGTKLAEQTTETAGQIRMITQQQQSATEQVTRSMDDASRQLSSTVAGIKQSTESMKSLSDLSTNLSELVRAFKLE